MKAMLVPLERLQKYSAIEKAARDYVQAELDDDWAQRDGALGPLADLLDIPKDKPA